MEVGGRGARLQTGLEAIERDLGLPTGVLFNVISLNPVSLLLETYRKVIYGGLTRVDGVLEWTPAVPPDFQILAVIFASGVVFTIIGTIIFKRLEPNFTKVL
jgi:ABC-type polysaccharide/polyol phosphate export permease